MIRPPMAFIKLSKDYLKRKNDKKKSTTTICDTERWPQLIYKVNTLICIFTNFQTKKNIEIVKKTIKTGISS